jgi:hypothetical protein
MSDEDDSSGNDVDNEQRYQTTTFADRYCIYFASKCTMVNGHLKSGIQIELAALLGLSKSTVSRQWSAMNKRLAPLLNNHPEDTHLMIIQMNSHFLFGDGKSARKKGHYKYNQEELAEVIKYVPVKARCSCKKLGMEVGMPKSTIKAYINPRDKDEQPLIV